MSSKQLRITKDFKLTLDLNNNNPSCSGIKLRNNNDNLEDQNSMDIHSASPSLNKDIPQLLSQIKNLNIKTPDVSSQYYPVGKVENIIKTMGLALIQSTSANLLVDIGTSVFIVLPSDSEEDEANPKYVLLGQVDDIFGSVGKPMYSVSLNASMIKNTNQLTNSFVYLLSNHPSTNILRVQTSDNKKYNVVTDKNNFYSY